MMDDLTRIDQAHANMQLSEGDAVARLRFYERIADGELFVLLEEEPRGADISPQVFEAEDGRFVLAFDREDRLAQFMEGEAPYIALSGRSLMAVLAGQGLGVGLNLDVAPSSTLLPDSAIAWMHQMLSDTAQERRLQPRTVHAPGALPEALLTALDAKLASAAGLADCAYLVEAEYEETGRNHLLVFVDAISDAQPALVEAVNETVIFSGIEAGSLDVGFCRASDDLAARLSKVGLRFDLPRPAQAIKKIQTPPGSDPDRPPILR